MNTSIISYLKAGGANFIGSGTPQYVYNRQKYTAVIQADDLSKLPGLSDIAHLDTDSYPFTTARLSTLDINRLAEVTRSINPGEISPLMLVDTGCTYVIIGHSERRQYFHETDDTVNKKIKAAKKAGLGIIMCMGESLEEREAGKTFEILQRETEKGLDGVDPESIVIAYEPIWAIGTGKTATTEQAQEAHAYIREKLRVSYGNKADELCIIYGGSVTPDNVDSLMACRDVDGALVGGASLKVDSFSRIVNFRR